jgi:cysteinyl-tRNA synthetase
MDDDFNTPNALRAVFGLVRDLNRRMDEGDLSTEGLRAAGEMLAEFGEILGLDLSAEGSREEDDKLMDGLLALLREVRQRLREKREWELADEIRGRLLDLGIVLEDKNQGANRDRDRG